MHIKALSRENRALLAELIRTDFKLRYQGSALGYSWSLLRPLMMFTILYTVFVHFFKVGKDIPHFPVYLLLGIIMWNFFVEMTTQTLGSVVGRGDLVRKIRIPRWIIVVSSSASALISLLLNMIILVVMMIIDKASPMATLIFFPLILVEIYVFALGVSLFLSAAYVRFRDISYIWEVVIQAMFYLTAIIYPLTLVSNVTIQKIMLLNPMAQAIQDARYAVVSHDPNVLTIGQVYGTWTARLIPLAIVVFCLIAGARFFRKESKTFAENL